MASSTRKTNTKTEALRRRPRLIKSRYFGSGKDEAESFVTKIRQEGGLAWLAEDHGYNGEFFGYRAHWATLVALKAHTVKAEGRLAKKGGGP